MTYSLMSMDTPSSRNRSPVALPAWSRNTTREKLFILLAVVLREGVCVGITDPPRACICSGGEILSQTSSQTDFFLLKELGQNSFNLTGIYSSGVLMVLVSWPWAENRRRVLQSYHLPAGKYASTLLPPARNTINSSRKRTGYAAHGIPRTSTHYDTCTGTLGPIPAFGQLFW